MFNAPPHYKFADAEALESFSAFCMQLLQCTLSDHAPLSPFVRDMGGRPGHSV